jgi:hypothetical protein
MRTSGTFASYSPMRAVVRPRKIGVRRQSFLLEALLVAVLVARCVPRFGAREDGPNGEGGEGGALEASGGTLAGKAGTSSASGGASGEAGDSGNGAGGDAGLAPGGRGGKAGSAGGSRTGGRGATGGEGAAEGGTGDSGGGAGGSTTGGTGLAGTTGGSSAGAGNEGSGGMPAGSGGGGTVRTCGTGGAPHAWANYCLPNHPDQGPHPQSYDTTRNGIVQDRVTGLVWEHPANGAFDQRTFADAALHCADLSSAAYGGYDDWRVPTVIELVSLTDYGVFAPAIDTAAFPNTPIGAFWTGSTYVNPSQAWEVDTQYGVVAPIDATIVANVRCVR